MRSICGIVVHAAPAAGRRVVGDRGAAQERETETAGRVRATAIAVGLVAGDRDVGGVAVPGSSAAHRTGIVDVQMHPLSRVSNVDPST